MRLRLCREPECDNYFIPKPINKIYCGSAKQKTGCSYKNRLRLNGKWNKEHLEANRIRANRWRDKNKEKINEYRRTPEYHLKVKRYKIRKYFGYIGFRPKWEQENKHKLTEEKVEGQKQLIQ